MVARTRQLIIFAITALLISIGIYAYDSSQQTNSTTSPSNYPETIASANTELAGQVLATLEIKGRAPSTDYAREQFGAGWAEIEGCEMRQIILARDLTNEIIDDDGCTVLTGFLKDPYTAQMISFTRGTSTSAEVQIDHVVALSDAWQKGAQAMDEPKRAQFSNDPLNLLAVDGRTNQQKSDSDAASWLPPNRDFRCHYVARQIAVKRQYNLWVTQAEYDEMARQLASCPEQRLPVQSVE